MLRFIPEKINDEQTAIKAFDNNTKIGKCAFTVKGYEMIFDDIVCADDMITEGLARAAMNYAANRNAYIAKISKNLVSEAFFRLGFKGDEILSVEIPEALGSSSCSGCCSSN